MSHINVILHCVWSTKNRIPILANNNRRYELFAHIRNTARQRGVFVDYIGGMPDHIHCLLCLNRDKTLAVIMREIKAESSHWYNSLGKERLEWQDDYFAVSVSPERIESVRNYIRNQEEHHRNRTFTEEYNQFLEWAGMKKS